MAETPWFLRALGLPPYADVSTVRRAYAQALRTIDQASDPEGFARLRAAYEAARAWSDQAIDEPPDDKTEASDDALPAEDADPALANAIDARWETAQLIDAFIAQTREADAGQAVEGLNRTIAVLRTRYVDAPGEFEERLVDLLAMEGLPHRATLFETAMIPFQWSDIGQLDALGERGAWVGRVLAERELWLRLTPSWRAHWLDLFARAARKLDASTVRHWPDVATLRAHYPRWIALHLDTATSQAWRAAFDAASMSTQAMYRQMAAPPEAFRVAAPTAVRRKSSHPWFGFLFFMAIGIAYNLLVAIHHGTVSPSSRSLPEDTPRTCGELHARLDRPDAFAGVDDDDADLMKRRGERCARLGYWHAPAAKEVR